MQGIDEAAALQCVGAGWAPLIKRLYAAMPQDTEVLQVKEKFGGLRFYTSGATEEFDAMIDRAEDESYSLCEWCGQLGSMDDNGRWLLTLCEQHKADRAAGGRYSRWSPP
jgi:hypothetical protein